MTPPPAYLALDLWQALHLPIEEFDGYFQRNGWADTWGNLLTAVRGPARCGQPDEFGDLCVLAPHDTGPHYPASDVGASEPLPEPTTRGLAAALFN